MSIALSPPTVQPELPRRAAPSGTAIPFGRLLRVEWFKTVDTRASRWLLAVIALVTVGLMVAPILATNDFNQDGDDYLAFAAYAVSLLLPVVAVLVMTSEWSQRTALTTFTQEPRRGRVILAKVGAAGILTGLACAFAAAVAAIALLVSTGLGRDVDWHVSASIAIGALLGVVLNVAMGVGFGVLLQNTAAAIVAFFALPIAFAVLATPLHAAGQWFDPTQLLDWVTSGDFGAHAAKFAVGFVLWIVLPITAGIVRTLRREIN